MEGFMNKDDWGWVDKRCDSCMAAECRCKPIKKELSMEHPKFIQLFGARYGSSNDLRTVVYALDENGEVWIRTWSDTLKKYKWEIA
jgi:hypothetical protein